MKRKQTKKRLLPICMNCDGVGWVEGGKTLKTVCHVCKGSGRASIKKQLKS